MSDYFSFLFAPLEPDNILAAFEAVPRLALAPDPYFWLLALIFVRYHLPALILWIVRLARPAALRAPATWPAGTRDPLVTVVIAGRNPGAGIRRTIESVLNNGYPNVEVVFADDRSTDDSVAHARALERAGRVRVFANAYHSGKPTNLNIACRLARGTFLFVLDADAELQYGALATMLAYFGDPLVGGVCANIEVRNPKASIWTRLQVLEYAINGSIARLWRARIGLLSILPGAATMFRTEAIRRVGYFDTGLGDDTDMTMRLRKARWRIDFAVDAWISTDQPSTLRALMKQRIRWTRNMVKVRLRKHLDSGNPRYGWDNTLIFVDHMLFRIILPLYGTYAISAALILHPTSRALFITGLYWFTTLMLVVKLLISNDIAGTPPLGALWLVFLFGIYKVILRFGDTWAMLREFLRIKTWHPYVPRHIWSEIPHH